MKVMKVMNKKLRNLLPETVKPDAAFKAMNLSLKLHVKLKFNINTTLFST